MVTASLASRSTLRLSEVARHVVIPEGIVDSEWPRLEQRIADMAIVFDRWQTNLGELIVGLTADGRYAATVGGVTLSIPRQVGKTFTIGVLIVALCIEFPGLVVLWTAHHGRTTTKTFRSIQSIVKRKRVAPHLAVGGGIRTANGEQEIAFANGSIIMFGAREHGFGRGIDGVDIIVFDEAQILGEKALEDMVATTNQSRHEHGALLFFMGTPPRANDQGEAFTSKRAKALDGRMRNGVYVECSADDDADPDDREQWAIANPSYPHHTPAEAMERMRENLPSIESWRLEAYGIWPKATQGLVMPAWPRCATSEAPVQPAALGVAMDPDRVWLSCGVVSSSDVPHLGPVTSGSNGRTMRVRVADPEFGRAQFVAEVARISRKYRLPVGLDRKGPAGDLEADLLAAGARVAPGGLDDYVAACAGLYDAVEAEEVSHANYADLDAAVAAAGWRKVGDRRVWARRAGDISMLEAVTWALWASIHQPPRRAAGF